jgi:hypothetical protein
MKLTSRSEVVAALLVAPIAMRDVKSPRMLSILSALTRTGDATFTAGYYSTTWTVAK